MEDKKYLEKRNAELINLILDFAIKNHMSMQEIDNCVDKVEKVYYTDGLIKRHQAES